MDKKQIIKKLVDKNVIREETEMEVEHLIMGFGSTPFPKKDVYAVETVFNESSVRGRSIDDGEYLDFTAEQVYQIDGMEPEKLAKAYNIKFK